MVLWKYLPRPRKSNYFGCAAKETSRKKSSRLCERPCWWKGRRIVKKQPILKRGNGEDSEGKTHQELKSDTKIIHTDEKLCCVVCILFK
jgi:hypothetical protein